MKKVTKKVVPLRYSPASIDNGCDWDITRTEDTVSFGCGAVKVNKADLITLADAIPAIKRLIKAWNRRGYNIDKTSEDLLKISPNILKRIAG